MSHRYSTLGDPIAFDGAPNITMQPCGACDGTHPTATGFLLRNRSAFATYFAHWNPHGPRWRVDMVIGSFEDPDYEDNVMFASTIERTDGGEAACSLVTPTWAQPDPPPILGSALERDVALEHPWLADFWQAIDWLSANDPFFSSPEDFE